MELVVYDPHPHIALIRSFLGYDVEESVFEVDDETYLKSLDPKNWKEQDHYAVLGLKKLRHLAGSDEIRRACMFSIYVPSDYFSDRNRILTHHPDKRRSKGDAVQDDSHDYFACITFAYEILGNSTKRHAYDSIDPFAPDDDPPTQSNIKSAFFACLPRFFSQKARESYDTARDYSYFDETKEHGGDRESRREIEKENRTERARRRADEVRLVRQVVHLARANDPRILAEHQAIKEAKEAKRQARIESARLRREAAEENERKKAEEEAALRQANEELRRQEADKQRKERERAKAEAKRERKRLRGLLANRYDYFSQSETAIKDPGARQVQLLADIDLLCKQISNIRLQEMNDRLEGASSPSEAQNILIAEVEAVKRQIQAPKVQDSVKSAGPTNENYESIPDKWTSDMVQILIKAVNILPAGTPKRWEAVAAYICQHVPDCTITGKEALKKAKDLKQDDFSLKKDVNEKAFDSFANSVRQVDAVKNVTITDQLEAEAPRPWSIAEQRALEQALRACPAQSAPGGPDRWQLIADMVGSRTRVECMLRCKELSEQVRAKKAAMASAALQSTSQPKTKAVANRR